MQIDPEVVFEIIATQFQSFSFEQAKGTENKSLFMDSLALFGPCAEQNNAVKFEALQVEQNTPKLT